MTGWGKRQKRLVVMDDTPARVEARVVELEKRGFKRVTEVKEDVGFMGDTKYVCVVENPKYGQKETPPN